MGLPGLQVEVTFQDIVDTGRGWWDLGCMTYDLLQFIINVHICTYTYTYMYIHTYSYIHIATHSLVIVRSWRIRIKFVAQQDAQFPAPQAMDLKIMRWSKALFSPWLERRAQLELGKSPTSIIFNNYSYIYIYLEHSYQRKLGSNTSVLRTNRILRLEMMKGGARLRLDLDEEWCEALHYITIHHKRIDLDEGWCETLHYITIHHKRIDLDEGWWETWHYITIHQKRIDLDEGWCETLHYILIHHKEDWPWWRVVWDITLHNNTSQKDWPWWRVVWDITLHNNTSQKGLTLMKGGVRHYITQQYITKGLTLMKGGVRLYIT